MTMRMVTHLFFVLLLTSDDSIPVVITNGIDDLGCFFCHVRVIWLLWLVAPATNGSISRSFFMLLAEPEGLRTKCCNESLVFSTFVLGNLFNAFVDFTEHWSTLLFCLMTILPFCLARSWTLVVFGVCGNFMWPLLTFPVALHILWFLWDFNKS